MSIRIIDHTFNENKLTNSFLVLLAALFPIAFAFLSPFVVDVHSSLLHEILLLVVLVAQQGLDALSNTKKFMIN